MKIYDNTNNEINCQTKYTHLDLFDDIKSDYIKEDFTFDTFPIDIEMYQYICNDENDSIKLPSKILNIINHYINKHNAKSKYYFVINDAAFFFTDKQLDNVSFENILQLKNKLKNNNFYIKYINFYNIS